MSIPDKVLNMGGEAIRAVPSLGPGMNDAYARVHGSNFIGIGTPEDIVFEITETRATYPADLAVDVVHALRKAGMLREGL